MEVVNKIHDGLHVDFNPYDQPVNTMRDNRNGIIMDLEDGSHMWTNLKGTLIVLETSVDTNIIAHCLIRDNLYLLAFNDDIDYVFIYKVEVDGSGDLGGVTNVWQGTNTAMNLSLDYPITSMFGFYENDNIIRIYFNDFNNPPRVVNIGAGGEVNIEEKFVNFFPEMNPVYGNFRFAYINPGGNCKAGVYFFSWRFFKEGYYTDWSYLTNPISVTPSTYGPWFDDYQDFQGGAPSENCSKTIGIVISELDTDYDSIQVAAFYSNDYNSAQPGMLFFDGEITSAEMTFNFNGNENLGTVTIDELIETTIVIERAKDMCHIKKMNVLGNVKEREEIDVSDLTGGKNNQVQVAMDYHVKPILLDTRNYSDETYTPGQDKALCGIRNVIKETIAHGLIPRVWYRAVTEVTFTDDVGARTISSGDVFTIVSEDGISIVSGSFSMAIVKRKYKPTGMGNYNPTLTGDDINDSILDIRTLNDGYYNYKNPLFVNELKGYPAGETVRLGVLYFDLTGRPFYVRHLYNTTTLWEGITIGPGDFTMPRAKGKPDDPYKPAQIHNIYSYDAVEKGFKFAIGNVKGITIDGLDITGIKDQIGGFSIVRCPIVRQRLAYGVLGHLIKDGNDVTIKPGFRGYMDDADVWDKGYSFFCPEDLFGLTGFSIQPGDKIVNEYYMDPYDPSEDVYGGIPGWEGYGRREGTLEYCLYQKFMEHTPVVEIPTIGNGKLETSHEVTFYTKFAMSDDADDGGIVIDPSNELTLFKEKTKVFNVDRYSRATNLGIVIFDELDGEGVDIKGIHDLDTDDPKILICSVMRENAYSYGGTEAPSLANSLYIGTGHYQEINDTVLADILTGGKYIFNGIEIFGGDTYIGMFDFNYLLHDDDEADCEVNHSFIIPLESRINIDLREGRHIAKDRSWSGVVGNTGLRRKVGDNRWSEFNYNDGYSTDNINDYYLPLPNNFDPLNTFDTRLRYSIVKAYGELEDSFRRFAPLDRLDLATEYGAITNIRTKLNRLVYWQRDAVGYVPINERALSSAALGSPVQLGVGGIFERHDEIITMVGNSNHFGLVESLAGFHWFDALRKVFITMGHNFQLSHDSIAKGLDSFFVNNIPDNMDEYDNPGKDYGIVGGYDIRNKLVLMTFKMPDDTNETIAYNIKKNKFVGYFDFNSRYYFNYKDWLYSIPNLKYKIHQHSEGVHGTYHEASSPMYFTIIVKDDSNAAKIFDNYEYIGSENAFTKLMYENSSQSIEETIANNRYIKFRNKRYFGNFPKVSRERLVDGYLKITFYYEGSDEVSFNELKTTFRKMI